QSGKLNAIALAHPRRVDAIAKVPTMAEAGMKDFEAATWFGLFAPSSMPDDLRQKIYQDVSKVVATPEMTRKLQDMGGEVNNSSPQQFQAFINEEARRWAEGVKLSGAQID
ncbi:tripartite tricarboxylate transporter substrate binding protein, partial [Bordetella hinzii]|nr:tripartite tricarboxylate transporter substrate binding protein [Bordetella hinzii]